MRADMGKVLVERPRPGSREGSRPRKGYRKRLERELESPDSPPAREAMKARCGGSRFFNEHLAPLRRFLNTNVGRPWDKVYSEICRHVDRGNVVQKHILTHLFDYVVTNVILIDGVPCRGEAYARQYGESLRTTHWRDQWYVCPKSGLLKRSRYVPRRRKRPEPPRRVVLNKTRMCLFIGNQWELVTVAPIPGLNEPAGYDVILRQRITDYWGGALARLYGSAVYAVARRPLSRQELMALPIPIEWLP